MSTFLGEMLIDYNGSCFGVDRIRIGLCESLKISGEGDSTPFLGNLFQFQTTLTQEFFLVSNQNSSLVLPSE